jgi:long-chain fatty acid transport protein
MKKIALLSLAAATALMAGGYKVPYVSLNSVAKGAANVAYTPGADAAYFNPANMAWMEDTSTMEIGLNYIKLSEVKFNGTVVLPSPYPARTGEDLSEAENKFVPNFHYVSPKVGDMTFGLSVVSPAGLAKRWTGDQGSLHAENFSLKTVEINPSVAYRINDKVAVAAGLRAVYSEAIAKAGIPVAKYQNLQGDGINYGYNFALSYRPTDETKFGLTYRSRIDLRMEDDSAELTLLGSTFESFGKASLPVPAALNVAAAYTLPSKTTVEFVYERTYWGDYKELNFDFTNATAEAQFGTPTAKNWQDSNSYRFSVTQQYNKWTAMAGFVIDESPIPSSTLNFETPDADSKTYSVGGRYQLNESMNVGLAALYNTKDDAAAANTTKGVIGTFSDSTAYIISGALEYKF